MAGSLLRCVRRCGSQNLPLACDALGQFDGVEGGADFGVVIEIDEDVAAFLGAVGGFENGVPGRLATTHPGQNPVGPLIEGT